MSAHRKSRSEIHLKPGRDSFEDAAAVNSGSIDEQAEAKANEQPETEFRLAQTYLEFYSAFNLLQRRYIASGLSQSTAPIRVEPFHLWNESQLFIALRAHRVVGCVTLLRPGHAAGLPLERSHPEVFPELPSEARFGEVTSLAIDRDQSSSTLEVFIGLSQLVQIFALDVNIDHLIAVVHPKHARFYKKAVGFRVIGDELPCSRVAGKPGVAMVGKIDSTTLCRQKFKCTYDPDRGSDTSLAPSPMTANQQDFFTRFLADEALGDSSDDRRTDRLRQRYG